MNKDSGLYSNALVIKFFKDGNYVGGIRTF